MDLSASSLHEDAALDVCRGRHGTRKILRCLGEGTAVTFSYRLAGALRPIPVEPSEEKCHNDRACGRTHPCRSEA